MTNTNPEAREVIARLETRRAYIAAGGYCDIDAFVNESWPNQVGFADAIIAALAAEGKVIEDDWRPIDSAPKSSRHILGFGDGPGIEQCCYVMRWEDADSGIDDWCEVYDGRIVKPTHWRPLPTPTLPPAGDDNANG